MPPPQLARHAPGLDIVQPVIIGLGPAFGHHLDRARSHRLDRRAGQRLGIDIPLIGQPRLDHHARSVAIGRLDHAVLDAVEQPRRLQRRHHGDARRLHRQAQIGVGDQSVRHLHDMRLAIEHVEHVARGKARAPPDLEIVEVVARRDLHRARSQLRIGMLVRHDPDRPPGDRQDHPLAHQRGIARIGRMHRHRHVGQQRLGPRRRHRDMPRSVLQRIAQMIEFALHLARLDLEIRNRGAQPRIPVHQSLVAVDQPLGVEIDEHLGHRLRKAGIHREPFVRPVARCAQPAQLARDRAAALLLPRPDAIDELLARQVGAFLAGGVHLPLHHHLRGDAGMIGADHPQRIAPLQPRVANQDVLQRIVERMADVQRTGDVRRRDDDRERFGVGPLGAEAARGFPVRIPARFDGGGVECLVDRHAPALAGQRARRKPRRPVASASGR